MTQSKSIALPPDELASVTVEVEGKFRSIKVPNRIEPSYRKAKVLIKDRFAQWKQQSVQRDDDSDFKDMMLVATEAIVDALIMKEEYIKLMNEVNNQIALLQKQLSSDTQD
jgi:hypothetical protein